MVAVPWGKRPFFFGAPSARAFGAGLRPGLRPPLAITYATIAARPLSDQVIKVSKGRCACRSAVVRLRRPLHPTGYDVGFQRSWATTWASILDHCADMNGAPLTRTPPRRSWGRGPPPQGWRRIQARRSTCLLLRTVQRRRVESLVLGALSSSPVHRAFVLVLGTNIAVLLDCSKSSRQCSLSYLLTYLPLSW